MRYEERWPVLLLNYLTKAKNIADDFRNPFMNDALGSMDCQKIYEKLEECIKILKDNYDDIK